MTAEQARRAIADGSLKPTWIDGQPVVGTDVETGRQRTERRMLLGQALREATDAHGRSLVLRLGTQIFTPQYNYRDMSDGRERVPLAWHEHHLSGFTYSDTPMTGRDVEQHLRAGSSWEIATVMEAYNGGFPMGAIAATVASGHTLADLDDNPLVMSTPTAIYVRDRARAAGLSGRPFKVRVIASGDRFTQADAYSLRE